MILSFHPCFAGDMQIILGDRHLTADEFFRIRQAEVIILPQGCHRSLYEACRDSSALLFPNYVRRFEFPGKIGQIRLFRRLAFPHPETLVWSTVDKFRKAWESSEDLHHGQPFIIKAENSHGGDGIHVISDFEDLSNCLEKLAQAEKEGQSGFLSQALIPSQGNVLRTVIMGKKIISYWKRPKELGQIITTINRGAKVDKSWRPDLQEKGRSRTQEFSAASGIDLAACDLIFDFDSSEPQPLLLEINYYFGRRGLGGSLNYYRLLHEAIQGWLTERGFDPNRIALF